MQEDKDAMILWLARELAKWELAADGHLMTPAIIEDLALRCIDAARRATEGHGRNSGTVPEAR